MADLITCGNSLPSSKSAGPLIRASLNMVTQFASDGFLISEHFEQDEACYAVCFLQRGSATLPSISEISKSDSSQPGEFGVLLALAASHRAPLHSPRTQPPAKGQPLRQNVAHMSFNGNLHRLTGRAKLQKLHCCRGGRRKGPAWVNKTPRPRKRQRCPGQDFAIEVVS